MWVWGLQGLGGALRRFRVFSGLGHVGLVELVGLICRVLVFGVRVWKTVRSQRIYCALVGLACKIVWAFVVLH